MKDRPNPPTRFYDGPKAAAYADRSARRHRAELALVRRLLDLVPRRGEVLDLPCGTGRLRPALEEWGFKVFSADLSPHMLRLAGQGVCADAARLPFRDGAFPLLVSNRFLHHLPPSRLEPVLAELARVAGEHLLVSFFHPLSLHGLVRRCQSLLSTRPSTRYSCYPGRLTAVLAGQGFRPCRHLAQSPYLRDLWYGLYRRS